MNLLIKISFFQQKFWLVFAFIFFSFVFSSCLFSQTIDQEIDSLRNLLKTAPDDSNKVLILRDISWDYRSIDNDRAIYYALQCLDLAKRIGHKYSIGISYSTLGSCYYNQGDYINAEINYVLALKIGEEIQNKSLIAGSLNSIANVYGDKSDYLKSLGYYLKALKLSEEAGEKMRVGQILINIGATYQELKNSDLAIQYYSEALGVLEESGNKNGLANCYSNIGSLYLEKKNFVKARENLSRCKEIFETLGDSLGISHSYFTFGIVFEGEKKYDLALKNYFLALDLGTRLNDNAWITEYNHNIGDVYRKMGKTELAIQYLNRCLGQAKEIQSTYFITQVYKSLAELYMDLSKVPSSPETRINYMTLAFENCQKYASLKDSTFTMESGKQIAEMQTKYDSEKKDSEIKLLNKDKEIQDSNLKKQRTFIYSVISVLFMVLALAFFVFRSYKQKKLANIQLEKKKQEIEIQNAALENANVEILHRKKEIEEKNEEVMSSIRYAKRIQDAMLKEEEKVTGHLPDHFVLFKPKDIVSGDFYWAAEKSGWWFVAVADCTGHGVPGAFLTLLGMSFLNEITIMDERKHPSDILDELRSRVIKELGHTGKEGESKDGVPTGSSVKDGMDISLLALNLETKEAEWAGANNALYLIRKNPSNGNGELSPVSETPFSLTEIKADKQPIGYFPDPHPFTNRKIQMHKGDSVYVFSDGYADQFGGPKGKKFKYSQFENILLSNQDKSMEQQKEILDQAIEKWKSWPDSNGSARNLEQIDDICIIGIRI